MRLRKSANNMYCKKGHEIQVLNSAAGYYIGTVDKEDGSSYCRLTGYYKSWGLAEAQLRDRGVIANTRNCVENEFCNGGSGCGPFRYDRV